jgi:hypothetical protein
MKFLLDSARRYILNRVQKPAPLLEMPFLAVCEQKEMLAEILEAKRRGRTVGIYSHALGQGMFLAGIDDVYFLMDQQILVLKPYDFYGNLLRRDHLLLDELKCIVPLSLIYTDPRKVESLNAVPQEIQAAAPRLMHA